MGNHITGHHKIRTNLASPRVSKVIVAEIWKQPVKIEVTQLFNAVIPTT
jgi:hypothetical protein